MFSEKTVLNSWYKRQEAFCDQYGKVLKLLKCNEYTNFNSKHTQTKKNLIATFSLNFISKSVGVNVVVHL